MGRAEPRAASTTRTSGGRRRTSLGSELVRRIRGRRHGPAALGYALLTGAVLWPAVVHFRSRPMADGVDAAMFSWAWWAMPRALVQGRNPYVTDLVFYPVGADLSLTTTAPLIGALTWPIRATLGAAAQVNVVQLASMFLAGIATYLLANRVCRHRGAAFVAGAAYALSPSRFVHVDSHLNLVETGVLPLGLYLLLRFVDVPSARRAVAVGLVSGAAFLIEPQLAILLAIGLVILGVANRGTLAPQAWLLVRAGIVAAIVAAPLLVPMLRAMASGGIGEAHPTSSTLVYSASPLSWVVPPLDRLWIGHVASLDPLTPTTEGIAYVGLLIVALAVGGAWLGLRASRKGWVAIALVGFVLSLGPYPFVRDTSVDIPMPFFLLRLVPGIGTMRVPGRFALLGTLGVCILAAVTLAELARRMPRRAGLVVALVCAVTIVELLPRSLPSRPADAPEPYELIAADKSDDAVLELPLKWSTTQRYYGFDGHDENFMFLVYAMTHQHPIVSGAVSRYPDDDLRRLTDIPVYRQVLSLGGEPGFDEPATFDQTDLRDLGIGFVVYHRDDPAPRALAYLRSLDMPVLADDGTVIVWKVAGARR